MDAARSPAVSLDRVREIVARARIRLRLQGAMEGATTASIVASAGALAAVFALRVDVIESPIAVAMLLASAAIIVTGALVGALRHFDDEDVARRIDRAGGLADRLSSAIAFDRLLSRNPGSTVGAEDGEHAETVALMRAAIRDAANVAPRANARAATPFRRPRDLTIAAGFAVVALLTAGLAPPTDPRQPRLFALQPAAAKAGVEVTISGEHLCGPGAEPGLPCRVDGAMVYLGEGTRAAQATAGATAVAVATSVTAWTGDQISFTVPAGAPIGKTQVVVWGKGRPWGSLAFEVLHERDARNFKDNTVALDPDDEAYLRELVADLKATGKNDDVKEFEEYAAKIEKLLDLAETGELTKEQLLEEMKKAEQALNDHAEPDQSEVNKDLAETGKQLQKNELTKELGEALAKNELGQAEKELQNLADKLEKGELSDKQQKDLAKTLEQVAQQFEKKQEQRDQKANDALQKKQDAVRRLEKAKDQAKNDQERQENERRLEKEKRELAELKKKEEQKEESAQRRSLKRLHKDMDKAAKQLQQKPEDQKDGEKDQGKQKENQKQASRSLKEVAEETGKVDQDQRKQAAQKKASSQMDDLREAMRRAKQRGQGGPENPFGKNKKNQDFAKRAGGGKGQKTAWKPGQGKGKGSGKGGQPGQGKNKGGQGNLPGDPSNTYGDGHDPNLVGDATGKSGDTRDEDVSGVHGKNGPSRREAVLSAAQKGFATAKYRDVYADYQKQIEAVMHSEKVPSSYKYYVKKYFTKIKPHAMD